MGKTRGRKPKLKKIACPNKHCSFFGKIGLSNIVANGTYYASGIKVHKFICRNCGKVFNSRQGTPFHYLHTRRDKVLLALKLLVKGMPLRGVAEVLRVKLDTVRNWLKRAALHSDQINQSLLKELKVSQIELDALWSFVKKKRLRQRAVFWQAKFGSDLVLRPKNVY